MGSDFRPHGCDPMGSAVGITPRMPVTLPFINKQVLTHPNSRARYLASWDASSSICELHAAPAAMLHECFAYGLGCIAYVLFVARFVA